MKSIYEERREKNRFRVISAETSDGNICDNAAVICYLYYPETVEKYYVYINNIPNEIRVYLITSNDIVMQMLTLYFGKRDQVTIIKKPNRGRDISGLLVTAKKIICNYKYICFVHDKAPRMKGLEEDTDLWIKNIWDNLVGSEHVIRNVHKCLDADAELGLLVPIEPFGEKMPLWLLNTWGANYKNVVSLAKKIGLNVNIEEKFPAISLGSAFWAKTKALDKLLSMDWKYDDFLDEPLPDDGTISHSIERILPYVAQDAGYVTETILSTMFIPKILSFAQDYSFFSARLLNATLSVWNIEELKSIESNRIRLGELISQGKKIYIYGAGYWGQRCLSTLILWNYDVEGFVVSHKTNDCQVKGVSIHGLEELKQELQKQIVIVAVKEEQMQKEIISNLNRINVDNYLLWI